MNSLRKWLWKPKKDDPSHLAQFYYADEDLNAVATELDSFDGRKDPDRCSHLINQLRHCQDKVLSVIFAMMEEVIPGERAARDFRGKFPDDVLQDNLAGQLWFGAECLAAGSSILNHELESVNMRPLAKAVTKCLENVRTLLREQCLRAVPEFSEKLTESLKIFDRLFAEFELHYVSAMVPVKSVKEYDIHQTVVVLFSETLQRALSRNLISQDVVDSYDPALMFTIPRLAIVTGLLVYPEGPLNLHAPADQMSELFRPFKSLLFRIRMLLWGMTDNEVQSLEKALCSQQDVFASHVEEEVVLPEDEKLHNEESCRGAQYQHNILNQGKVSPTASFPSTESDDTVSSETMESVRESISVKLRNALKNAPPPPPSPHTEEDRLLNDLDSPEPQDNGRPSIATPHSQMYGKDSGTRYTDSSSSDSSACKHVKVASSTQSKREKGSSRRRSQKRSEQERCKCGRQIADKTKDYSSSSTSRRDKRSKSALPGQPSYRREKGKHVHKCSSKVEFSGGDEEKKHKKKKIRKKPKHPNRKSKRKNRVRYSSTDDNTSTYESDSDDEEEIALALEAAEYASRKRVRAKYKSSSDLVHRLFVCISGVADQLQSNFAGDLRNILRVVFQINASAVEESEPEVVEEEEVSVETAEEAITEEVADEESPVTTNHSGNQLFIHSGSTDLGFYNEDGREFLTTGFDHVPEGILNSNYLNSNINTTNEQLVITGWSQFDPRNLYERPEQSRVPVCQETRINNRRENAEIDYSNQYYIPSNIYNHDPHDDGCYAVEEEVQVRESPPPWIPDSFAPKCMICEGKFTMVRRRHHCRNCGQVFCSRCSSNSVPLPHYGIHKPVRVCNRCFMYCLSPIILHQS